MKSGAQLNLVFVLLFVYFNGVNGQQSPCPDIFEYKFDGYQWYGAITLPSMGRIRTTIAVKLSVEDTLSQDNSGSLQLLNDINTLHATLDNGGPLQYKNVFPNSPQIPTVNSIKLNKQEFCSNPQGPVIGAVSTITVIHTFEPDSTQPGVQVLPPSTPQIRPQQQLPPAPRPQPRPTTTTLPPEPEFETHFNPTSSSINDVNWLESMPTSATCGYRKEPGNGSLVAVHTIINGMKVEPGEYPWLAALYDPTGAFICGGSLVTNKHVISAAHCINVRWLNVELGRYNRRDYSESVILRQTNKFEIHPEYKKQTGHADIAILFLTEEVRFSEKIRPICLSPFGLGGVGQKGRIVGWGTDLSGSDTDEAQQTIVDIVSQKNCLEQSELFQQITSSNTYCAGGKGTGPCKGDSGGGMYINVNNRWYLKGIISTSLGPNAYSCNVELFAVYADVSTFLDWLQRYLI